MVDAQIATVLDDLPVRAVKTGLLGAPAIIEVVGRRAAAGDLPRLVVDPVMVASTGRIFLVEEGIDAYRRHLLPQALIATPNLWEAALLADRAPTGEEDVEAMVDMARRIHELGPDLGAGQGRPPPRGRVPTREWHPPDQVADVLFDGTTVTVLTGGRVDTPNNHGTGCSLSAAIAACLAHGADVPDAVSAAKEFVLGALRGGAAWRLGQGHGPLDHLGWTASHRRASPPRCEQRPYPPGYPEPAGPRAAARSAPSWHDSGRAFRPGHSPPISQDRSAVLVQAPLLGTSPPLIRALAL